MNMTSKNFEQKYLQNTPLQVTPMIDAKQAACALRLPLYWFADPKMRSKHRVPHYLLGGLVRFRMSELSLWAAAGRVHRDLVTLENQSEATSHDGFQ
jgi:hypothetical protein